MEAAQKAKLLDQIKELNKAKASASGLDLLDIIDEILSLRQQINPKATNQTGDFDTQNKVIQGRSNNVKTAKGTKVATVLAITELENVKASHTASGAKNPDYPQELQPRDRSRDSSIAWVNKTANNLDPESLGRSGRADTGAPIVGDDMVVESGNGRTMAIQAAYAAGKADEYKQWLIDEADYFGFNALQVEQFDQPILIRIRQTPIDRVQFAVECNQDDKLSYSATERAKTDAKRLDDRLMSLFKPSENGDLLTADNRAFMQGFLQSLGDTEAAQYLTKDGKFTQALVARVKAAVFSKAYNDERLLEMMADQSKPDLQNILNALSAAAPNFVEAQAIDRGDVQDVASAIVDGVEQTLDQRLENAIIDATNVILNAKANQQDIQEFVRQQGLFGDLDEGVANIAVFLTIHSRSAKKMAVFFKAMAEYAKKQAAYNQNLSLFDEPLTVSIKDAFDYANEQLKSEYGDNINLGMFDGLDPLERLEKLDELNELFNQKSQATDALEVLDLVDEIMALRLELGMNDAPTYSTDNPFAQYANDDPEVKQNADDWENRKPLTQERLAAMNAMAQRMGYATYIEARHASLGTFQAEKGNGNRRAEIGGKFINNDGNSAKDASTDFELALYENGEIEDYLYTNDLNQALERGNDWLADGETERITELSQILADLQAGRQDPMGLDFAHIATLVDDDRDAANEIRAYLDTHWLSEVA